MLTPEDVLFKLGQLVPGEIARLMKDSGVQALRGCPDACAVTQYVYQETRAANISTGSELLIYGEQKDTYVELPETVQAFINSFDIGCYPELDAWWPENV